MPAELQLETVAELLRRQVLVPLWMERAVAGLRPDELVEVERYVAAFGSYVLHVRPASSPEPLPAEAERDAVRELLGGGAVIREEPAAGWVVCARCRERHPERELSAGPGVTFHRCEPKR